MTTPLPRTCENCRYWAADNDGEMRECRWNPPIVNGKERGLWPITCADDTCGRFTFPSGAGTERKIADEEILDMVKQGTNNPAKAPLRRSTLLKRICDAAGIARNSAQERVERLVKRGSLVVGYVNPPNHKKWPKNALAVWLPDAEPEGAHDQVMPEDGREKGLPGRPPIHSVENYHRAVWEATRAGAVNKADITRALRTVSPTLGQPTAYRLIAQMEEMGFLNERDGMYQSVLDERMIEEFEQGKAVVGGPEIEIE